MTSEINSEVAEQGAQVRRARWLIRGGIVAGPLFLVVAVALMLVRPGFDLSRHALSMLSLGSGGWLQIANFVIAGVLVVGSAVGLRHVLHRGRAAIAGPALLGIYGAGLIVAGIFVTDPALGFPPGTPDTQPSSLSWHAGLHTLGFALAILSLTAAAFVFARRLAGDGSRAWSVFSIACGVAIPLLVGAGFAQVIPTGIAFFVATVVCWTWHSSIAARFLRTS